MNILFKSFLSCICILWSFSSAIANTLDQHFPLALVEAFAFHSDISQAGTIVLKWEIAPGYFLYKDKLHIETTPAIALENAAFDDSPHPKLLSGIIEWPVRYDPRSPSFQITVRYQGCAESGFCYPPQEHTFWVTTHPSAYSPPLLGSFFLLGLLLAITPCMLPMLPILLGILSRPRSSHKTAFWHSACYVLGMSFTYALAGSAFAFLGQHIQSALQTPPILSVAAVFFMLLGCAQYGYIPLKFPQSFQNKIQNQLGYFPKGHAFGAFGMGIVSSLILSPCITPPLLGTLGYIAETGDVIGGGLGLFTLSFGMGTPLLILSILGPRYLPRTGPWMQWVNELLALSLFAMAIWLLGRFLSHVSWLLWAIFGLFTIGRIVFLLKLRWLTSAVLCLAYCLGLFFWTKSTLQSCPLSEVPSVENKYALDKEIYLAKKLQKPVVLEFYADWCASCQYFDHITRHQTAFKDALVHWHVIRVNITKRSQETLRLLESYQVVAPPTFIFLDSEGLEIQSRRYSGSPSLSTFAPIRS